MPALTAYATTSLPDVATSPVRSNAVFGGTMVWYSKYSPAAGVDAAEIDKFTAIGEPVVFVNDTLKVLGVAPAVYTVVFVTAAKAA